MNQIDKQLWSERIARALADLKKDSLAHDPDIGVARQAVEAIQPKTKPCGG